MTDSKTDPLRTDPASAARLLGALVNGYQTTALLYVAARLGIADFLADGPAESAELARSLGAHAPSLHRILRGLAALGVFREEPDGRFGLSELGNLLRTGTPGSLRNMAIVCGEEYVGAWGGLVHSAMTGGTAFNHVFGMSQWEHRRQHVQLSAGFNRDLAEETARAAEAIVAACDFSRFGTIADIGGGRGALLAAILRDCPAAEGILFDRPHVTPEAEKHLAAQRVIARCRVIGGDFFDSVPGGADAHILKSVIHDWDDERSAAILTNCRAALNDGGVLLLVERLMPKRAADDPPTILVDVQMLAITGGRERSEAEYRALFARTGFTLTRVIPTRSPFNIIEATPTE